MMIIDKPPKKAYIISIPHKKGGTSLLFALHCYLNIFAVTA